ncbi:GPI-anchored protein LLG3-like [Trifolium pratense]|uniref:GPI-anchored protein LLG3-like n=1 Tax=Trifolium pratense TaxID=57577 RepID=UPI001E691ACF|nr:GPI-anchored protein LLG3-like [Trifolium pratense]
MAMSSCWMQSKIINVSSILSFFLLATLVSSSPFISDDIFEYSATNGRVLLQAKKACSVDFENQNYTILTSQCKGPQYPPKVCCDAFKQFACPFSEQINDMTTDCATVMFSYINIYGKYPPGLFANECKEGKEGLDCSNVTITNSSNPSSSVHVAVPHSMLLVSIVGFFGFIFHLF